ncbi:MAG: hypothetical protein ABI808_01720 [Pseudonocardiales bacterium]
MSERQLFDLLAQDAPATRPNLADEVIDQARHNRVRKWAVSGACAAVALIAAVPLTIALNRSPQPTHRTAVGGGVTNTRTADTTPPTEALIYAAAMRQLPNPGGPNPTWSSIEILDHSCTNVVNAFVGPCDPLPIPAAIQRAVLTLLPKAPPAQFLHVAKDYQPTQRPGSEEFITFGRVSITGHSARLPVAVQCGFDCATGATLVLVEKHGAWTVTGMTGPIWIA